MKTKTLLITVLLLYIGTFSMAQSKEKVNKIIKDCKAAKNEFLRSDFEMEKHFANAYGYVIFPNVGKGGAGIGGAAGNGIAYERGKMIGVVKLTQLSIGFQWGGQAYREVVFFESKNKFDKIKDNKVKLAAQVSAVAANKGASANAKYEEGIMIFTMQKGGLMYEASVGGQKFKFKPYKSKD